MILFSNTCYLLLNKQHVYYYNTATNLIIETKDEPVDMTLLSNKHKHKKMNHSDHPKLYNNRVTKVRYGVGRR